MKKTSFFFILIFSVFFSYQTHTVFADACPVNISTFTGADDYINENTTFTNGSDYTYTTINTGGTTVCYGFNSSYTDAGTILGNGGDYYRAINGTSGGLGSSLCNNFGCAVDGYYLSFRPSTAVSPMSYITYFVSGGVGVPYNPIPPIDTQGTYNESPYNGEVVATSGTGDVLVAFDYYLDTDQDPDHDTAQWCMRLVRNDGAGDAEYCDDVAFDTYTEVSHTFTGLALDSQWDWTIIFTRPGFFIDEYSILHGGSNYFWAGRFTIDSTVQEIYTAYTTCSITDLAGCFQNAIVFLFYPSQSSLNDFSSLYDAIKNKPPFGYISAVQTSLQGINDTQTGVFTLETMPILDTYIFTPMRTALIWIMWLAFIFMFYHRLKNIHL